MTRAVCLCRNSTAIAAHCPMHKPVPSSGEIASFVSLGTYEDGCQKTTWRNFHENGHQHVCVCGQYDPHESAAAPAEARKEIGRLQLLHRTGMKVQDVYEHKIAALELQVEDLNETVLADALGVSRLTQENARLKEQIESFASSRPNYQELRDQLKQTEEERDRLLTVGSEDPPGWQIAGWAVNEAQDMTAIAAAINRAVEKLTAERDRLKDENAWLEGDRVCENGHHHHDDCSEKCSCFASGKSQLEAVEQRADEMEAERDAALAHLKNCVTLCKRTDYHTHTETHTVGFPSDVAPKNGAALAPASDKEEK